MFRIQVSKNKIIRWGSTLFLSILPVPAAAVRTPQTFDQLVGLFIGMINLLFPIIAGLSMIVFFWGLSRFILAAEDEKTHSQGKTLMFWGVIGFFVMSGVWGLVAIITRTFGFGLIFPFLPI